MAATDQIGGLRARWARLTDRERNLLYGLAAAVLIIAVLGMGFSIASGLSDLEDTNEEMRQALKDIEQHRDEYQRAKAKTAQVEVRLGHGGVALQGFLESASKEAGVEIAETVERQPQALGKKYVERSVDLRLRRVGLEPLAKFLRKIETGPNLVVVTSLNVRTTDDKHEQLEVEMSVSTYEHATDAKATHKKEGKG